MAAERNNLSMVETEIEIKVSSLIPTRKKLKAKGKLVKRLKSNDFFFDEKLFSQDVLLRLRDISTLFPEKRREAVVTYKAPKKVKAGIQSRREVEFKADNFVSVFETFKAVFGDPVLTFSWIGEKYIYKDCTIWLKDTIGVVKFVEIEGKREDIENVRNELSIRGEILDIGALELAKKIIRKE